MTNNRPNAIVDDSNIQKPSQAKPLSNTDSKGGKEPVGNPRVEQAIKDGQENSDLEASESLDCTIELSKEAQEQLKQVSKALNLNFPTAIYSAINYVYFLNQDHKININEIISDSPENNEKRQNLHKHKVTLFGDTNSKLEKIGLKDRLSDCVIAGIRLLYENNCLVKPNQQSSETSSSPSL